MTAAFFTLSRTADEANISRQTLREWLNAQLVAQPRHKLIGSERELPLFSEDEARAVREIAAERTKRFRALRLAQVAKQPPAPAFSREGFPLAKSAR